jgi:spore coat polysaccharide biosynthesis protein SpsF
MPKVLAIVQARMGSNRFPGKVLRTILGRPILWYVVERARQARRVDELIVATSALSGDDPIEGFCRDNGTPVWRGSEHDVLERFHTAAQHFGGEWILRITSDCPLLDPALVDALIDAVRNAGADYGGLDDSCYPDGFNAEVFTYAALERAFRGARKRSEREHVTPYFKSNPGLFRCLPYGSKRTSAEQGFPQLHNLNHMLLSLDEPYDLEVLTAIIKRLYDRVPRFSLQDVLTLVASGECPAPRLDARGSAVGLQKSLEEEVCK